MFIELEEPNLHKLIKEADGLVIVDFYANWCAPCMKLKPVLHAIGNARSDLTVIAVNTDKFDEISAEFKIYTIPSVFYIKDGKILENQLGYKNREAIEAFIATINK